MNAPKFPALRSLEEALAELLTAVQPLDEVEIVSTFEADRRVLAQDVISPLDVPGFDNSQMDGYALRSADVREAGVVLQVTQRIPAGHFGKAMEPLSAARIFTGAPMPPGADCVVMQEDCETVNECEGGVRINTVPKLGQWVRSRGEDVKQGSLALSKGELLAPAALGLAASLGMDKLQVSRRPRVALFSTGDELVMPGEVAPHDMKPGAIYNSNRFFLRAMLLRAGCEVTDLGIVPDQRDATLNALQKAAVSHDVILTSGGVSVGEEDHIKPAVQQLGSLDLWSISMKPGKPFAYGRVNRSGQGFAHFVGLPGNPVSSFVTFLLLVRPLLARLQGQSGDLSTIDSVALRADFTLAKADKRREFLRARRNVAGGLDLFPNQNSSVLTSAVWADGLVDVPAGHKITEGDMVRFIPFSSLL
ncbi:gephyrin-like molybdotransferase Glp [Variovorax sp. PCZ-1]|uniref:molybdopterin molybdotransferase MoeA n=1 Tax=Variovorax sp. PCZ-1 TaxID=2835533 RepID=UPI001BD1639F|nr:gephyrin-like molybdotransferase Glp [Variovorax sp. PCZ-1]MBS7807080.1 molybdopterin molybdotransferase MoeA [Variovorax sp. PCZ-1]